MATNLDARLAGYHSPVLSIFRIIFGLLYMLHGSIKLFGWPLGTKVPVGTWPAWWAGLIEFVLGLLIVIGLFTRIAAFIASGEMAVAYFWMSLAAAEGRSVGQLLAARPEIGRQWWRAGHHVLLRVPAAGDHRRRRVVYRRPEAARRHDGRGTTSAIWPAALGITLR